MKHLRYRFWCLATDVAYRVFGYDSRAYDFCLTRCIDAASTDGEAPW